VPQILGPILDTISYSENVLVDELNSANDNPVIDAETQNVYHGGNFHGDYVALEMDKLKIAITKLVMLSERQINYLLNNKLNEKFPPFLNLGVLGLNLGLQGMQFSATSTTAECQTLAFPMYLHSIPNNADNQDIVSMGTNAALITAKVIENGFQVLAIQIIMLTQAFEHFGNDDKLSKFSKNTLTEFRQQFSPSKTDRTFYQDIEKMKNWLSNNKSQLI
jgi:histidine ammonia-lyase